MSIHDPFDRFGDPDEVAKARGNRRATFSQAEIDNPWRFVTWDNALITLSPTQQTQAIKQLRAIAGAEGSALGTDWKSLVDPEVSLSANKQTLLDRGGKLPLEQREAEQFTENEVEEIETSRARQDILDACRDLDAAGVDGAAALEALAAGESNNATEQAADAGVAVDDVEGMLMDIADAFSQALVDEAIVECREELEPAPQEVELTEADVISRLRDNFDLPGGVARLEDAIEVLETEVEGAQAEGRQEAVARISRAFGQRFEDVDDAIERIQDRLERTRGPTVRSAPITVRERATGEPSVRIESDNPDFAGFRSNVQREVRRQLDLSELPRTRREIGVVRLEDGELADIDLAEGRELLGAEPGEQPFEPREREPREQEQLPDVETEPEAVAADLIDALER